jgi:site-specific DNA-cytosine methylase
MRRQRTLVVGWRKDVFKDSIPLLSMEAEPQVTTKDVIGHLYNYNVGDPNIPKHVLMGDRIWGSVENLFGYVPNESTTLLGFINRWSEVDPQLTDPICMKEVEKQIDRLNKGLRLWDKSPYRVSEDGYCPSLTSVTKIIHPVHNRTFTIREYASLMGYPMDFVFYPNECNVPTIQAIAQGVPKYFAKYIATEVKESLLNNRELISDSLDKVLSFQHNTYKTFQLYDLTGINNITSLIK